MKKKIYYMMPFVVVPFSMVLLELLDNTVLKMSPFAFFAAPLLISAFFGFFSPTSRTFDYFMTAIMPLSLFCSMFIAGFLDKNDLETRFNLNEAVDASFQPLSLLLYFLMAIVTLGASFICFRNIKKRMTKQ